MKSENVTGVKYWQI